MSAKSALAVDYEEPEDEHSAPVITLIGADIPDAYFDEAEPSPLMESFARFFSRIGNLFKLAIVLILVGGYPFAVVSSHKIDTNPIMLGPQSDWASKQAGIMVHLTGREIAATGWAGDRAGWHPQSRLTALPAWQDGLIAAMSDQAQLMSNFAAVNGEADQDLQAAARLLVPSSDGRAVPRLNAAAEALQRYDGRVSRGLAKSVEGQAYLQAQVSLYADWFAGSASALSNRVGKAEGWPAAKADVEMIYGTRARAHVASELLSTLLLSDPSLVETRAASEAREGAITALRRVVDFNPVFISSQDGSNRFFADHPATIAFYASNAADALDRFKIALQVQQDEAMGMASAETGSSEEGNQAPPT